MIGFRRFRSFGQTLLGRVPFVSRARLSPARPVPLNFRERRSFPRLRGRFPGLGRAVPARLGWRGWLY